MTVPVGMLVGFATWTVLLLLATIGVYRWSRILTGRVPIRSFGADQIEGSGLVQTRDAGPRELRRESAGFWRNRFRTVRWQRGRRLGECAGSRGSSCPHNAIAGARMFRSDQHDGIRTLRVLFRADRQFSVVDWDPADKLSGLA